MRGSMLARRVTGKLDLKRARRSAVNPIFYSRFKRTVNAETPRPDRLRTPPSSRWGSACLRLSFDKAALIPKRRERLPHAAESHGDRLAVHAPGSVAAQERDHLRDLARLQHPVLRVDRGALAPHLLDADAAPFGLRLRRALGHCRSHPARQHCVGCDSDGPASWATARASPMSPCLEAVYALPERSAFSPAVELVNTSRPKPRLHMLPSVSRASSNGPSRLMRIVSRQTSGSCSHTSRSWAEPIPWFTTSTSIGPSRRSVSATARAQPSAVPRSAATYSRPTAASSVALRATAITRAPAADSSSAASRPIPRPPPVTRATRPFIPRLPYAGSRNRPTLG